MKPRLDRKIFSLRHPVLFDGRGDLQARVAQDAATRMLGGEIGSHAEFLRSVESAGVPTFLECTRARIRFAAPASEFELLPNGYYYKGGAARQMLGRLLGVHAPPPRDIDLVRFGGVWNAGDTAISKRLMPLDFERGFGVEICSDMRRYHATRDLSVNEVIYGNGEVLASPIAVFDTLGGVLRPCQYIGGSIHRAPALRSATVMKMLRLRAEGIVDGFPWALIGVPPRQDIEPFDVALQLDKAFARSRRVAEVFIDQCHAVGIFADAEPAEDRFVGSLATIVARLYEPERLFRNIPVDILAAARQAQAEA